MPLALLAGPLGKLIVIALAVASIFGIGYYRGYQAEKQAWDASISEQAVKTAKQVIEQSKNTARVETKYIKLKGETETIYQTIQKEVPVYVTDARCDIALGFVELWNRANIGLPSTSPAASGVDATTTGLTLADVARQHVTRSEERRVGKECRL